MRLPCAIYRGGTSKPALFLEGDLPEDPNARERLLLSVFGSPDPRQIDGIGGGDPLTSKVAIVGPTSHLGCDLQYTMGYVCLDRPFIDWEGNCGNSSAAVAPFALLRGLIPPMGSVTMYNTNTDRVVISEFNIKQGRHDPHGETVIGGVPGTSSPVYLTFLDVGGESTGRLLPTGQPRDIIRLEEGEFEVSIVDACDVVIFVRGAGLSIELMQKIRAAGAKLIGVECGPALPKIACVDVRDGQVHAATLALNTWHKAYAVSGAIALTAASHLEGTVVPSFEEFHHPSGQMSVEMDMDKGQIKSARVVRTARLIMEGEVNCTI